MGVIVLVGVGMVVMEETGGAHNFPFSNLQKPSRAAVRVDNTIHAQVILGEGGKRRREEEKEGKGQGEEG